MQYSGYHLVCRGEIPVKGKGHMKTYFLCGKDGFKKELPKCDDVENGKETRVSQTSLNSMASFMSSPSSSSFYQPTFGPTPKMSQASQLSNISNVSRCTQITNISSDSETDQQSVQASNSTQGIDLDERYKSKQTSILEVTCL